MFRSVQEGLGETGRFLECPGESWRILEVLKSLGGSKMVLNLQSGSRRVRRVPEGPKGPEGSRRVLRSNRVQEDP